MDEGIALTGDWVYETHNSKTPAVYSFMSISQILGGLDNPVFIRQVI